jgi:hypothetical protein
MADEVPSAPQPVPTNPEHHGILDKTFGEIIQNNQQAQGIIMKAMNISPQKLQEMLQATGDNQMMNMTIRDMFKSGIMQQAASGKVPPQMMQGQAVQVTPEQMQQIMNTVPNGQMTPEQFQQITGQSVQQGQMAQGVQIQPQKQSFLQKLKGLFG